jgi:excisionase family DNA binding protein
MRESEFTTKEVAQLINVPYTTLDRWIAAGAIVPEVQAEGTGSRRRFTFEDLILAELAHVLKEHHLTLPDIAKICEVARQHWPTNALLISPDNGLVLGELPISAENLETPLGDGWIWRDLDKPDHPPEVLFHVDLNAIRRRMQERITELKSGGEREQEESDDGNNRA